jgi:hypothetical protein
MPFGWILLDLLTTKIKLRCIKSTGLGTLPLCTARIRIRMCIKQSNPDPYQIKKKDPDQYQSEKQDPDPYQKGLDPQYVSSPPRNFWSYFYQKTRFWSGNRTR